MRFGYEPTLEYVCSFRGLLHPPEVIGPVPEGIRINFHIAGGQVDGPKLRGKIRPGGGDFVTLRHDGIAMLHVHATIETHDGALIDLSVSGVGDGGEDCYHTVLKGDPPPPNVPLREAVLLESVHPDYVWLNRLQLIGIGEMVRARSAVCVDFYALM